MRFTTTLAALAASIPFTAAYWKGFNVGANNPDGSCKTQAQWEEAFNKLKALPQHISSVRLYASSDCNTLEYAVPAAINTNTGILVGVWAEDATHYANEKTALYNAIEAHGHDWIIAISVGSEDLYRGDTSAYDLAVKINDTRKMVRGQGVNAQVGHVDTWTAWYDGNNKEAIYASEFIGMDAYPYWQSASIVDAYSTFFDAYQKTKDAVSAVGSDAWVWVTETSWPVTGKTLGAAEPSVPNAQWYWNTVACEMFNSGHVFWYAYQDYNASPSFGIFDAEGNALYDLGSC